MVADIVIFDIDGTLADVSSRVHHLHKTPKDWDAFFEAIPQDKAIHSMVRLCNILYEAGLKILLCSGRSEQYRPETVDWLTRQQVKYHELLLRREEDRRSDAVVKQEILAGLDRSQILFVVEDRQGVVDMWRSEGLVCLQCAPGDF